MKFGIILFFIVLAKNGHCNQLVQGSVAATTSSNFYKTGTDDHQAGTDVELSLAGKMSATTNLTGYLSLNKQWTGERKSDFQDSYIGISQKFLNDGGFKLSGLLRVYFPVNEDQREIDRLQTKVYIAPVFRYEFEQELKGLMVSYRPSFSKSFHQYTKTAGGGPLTEFNISQLFETEYSFDENWSVYAIYIYSTSWDYESEQDNSFYLSGGLSYSLNNSWGYSIGWANQASTLAPNGTDSNIKIFDDESSTVFFSIEYSF